MDPSHGDPNAIVEDVAAPKAEGEKFEDNAPVSASGSRSQETKVVDGEHHPDEDPAYNCVHGCASRLGHWQHIPA